MDPPARWELAHGRLRLRLAARRTPLPAHPDLRPSLLSAWRTNNRVTTELIGHLPEALWGLRVPGAQRTIRAIAVHMHNARCSWLKTLGQEHGVPTPPRVDHRRAAPGQVVTALERSGSAMEALFELGFTSEGQLPPSRGYVWRNLAVDVGHVVTYFIAHEAHHRGQIVLVARQTGHRLPQAATTALWQWKARGGGSA